MTAPLDLGLPAKFQSWRPGQFDTIFEILGSPTRFSGVCLPTGTGKSITALAVAAMRRQIALAADPNRRFRAAVLTSTKALQQQYGCDFSESGLVDIRGKSNYLCRILEEDGEEYRQCDAGECKVGGVPCRFYNDGCHYYDGVRRAKDADLVVTNYAYWLHHDEWDLGDFDLLILDEAHSAPEELAKHLGTFLTDWELQALRGRDQGEGYSPLTHPAEFAAWHLPTVKRWLENAGDAKTRKRHRDLEKRLLKLRLLGKRAADTLIWEERTIGGGGYSFDPLWPTPFASYLWRDIENVMLMSATIRPKTLSLLGLRRNDGVEPEGDVLDNRYSWIERGSPFPVDRRLIYHTKTKPGVRLNSKAGPETLQAWVDRIDAIMGARGDRKGIVHTISYDRAKLLALKSRHANRFILPERSTTQAEVARFKALPPSSGAVLVSPSVHTGYDFPYDAADYNIIGKLAFPDTRSKLAKARDEADPEWSHFQVATHLVQAAGRGTRAADDYCETFIVDDSISWWRGQNGYLLPTWFQEAFRTVFDVPAPLDRPR